MVGTSVGFGFANLKVFIMSISKTLRKFNTKVNYWYLDGFAPNKNPEM
jgi:tRNA U34 5-methylaminomethyl-2-thiouridine-forming methyltransferase MnmC